jgi:hypothetical protein
MRKEKNPMMATQLSKGEGNAALLSHGSKLFSAHFCILMLMIGFVLTGAQLNAYAQGCWEACQQNLAGCLQAAQGDPLQEVRCQNDYDKCGADCML